MRTIDDLISETYIKPEYKKLSKQIEYNLKYKLNDDKNIIHFLNESNSVLYDYIIINNIISKFLEFDYNNIRIIDIGNGNRYKLIGINTERQTTMRHATALVYNEKHTKWYYYDDLKPPIKEFDTIQDFLDDSETKSLGIKIDMFVSKLIKGSSKQQQKTVLNLICDIIKP